MNRSAAPLFPPDVQAAAADWIARRNGDFTAADEAALSAWLAADLRHAAAYADAERAWVFLNTPRATGDADAIRAAVAAKAARRRRSRWRVLYGSAAAAVAAVVVFAFVLRSQPPAPYAPPSPGAATVVVRPDLRTLPDGSSVELNAGAEIDVEFTPERRLVHLRRGEALFRVEKDTARPFVVDANGIQVRAVGTAFNVRLADTGVEVTVTEGKVDVTSSMDFRPELAGIPSSSISAPVQLGAGERTLVSFVPELAPTVMPISPEQLTQTLAWRGRRVEFTGTSLAEAVELFNQQNGTKLSVGDAASAKLEITGIFWADDPEGFVRLLESGELVRATRTRDGVILRAVR